MRAEKKVFHQFTGGVLLVLFNLLCCALFLCRPIESHSTSIGKAGNKAQAATSQLRLTPVEAAWLKANPVIRVAGDIDWPPFNFSRNGLLQGYSIDYLNLLAKRVGFKIKYITGPTWDEFLKMMKTGQLEVISDIVKTAERQKYLLYTLPYGNNPNTILSRNNQTYQNLTALFGKTVAITKGFFYEEILTRDYPQIKILTVNNTFETMKAVSFGQADAAFGEFAVFNHLINEHMMTGLAISGEVELGDPALALINIATRKNLPLLVSILEKGMASITQEERQGLHRRWGSERLIADAAEKKEITIIAVGQDPFDTTWLVISAGVVFILLFVVALLLTRFYPTEDLMRHFESSRTRVIALVTVSLITMLVTGLVVYALTQNRQFVVHSTQEDLKATLSSTMERLDFWVHERKNFLLRLGRNPELVEMTKRLLKVPATRKTLEVAQAQQDLRAFFLKNETEFGKIGFFIINHRQISIASSRNSNLGTRNLIAEQKPALLAAAFQGEAVFIPPIRSDVVISVARHMRKPLTMFFAVPIRDRDGTVLAVLTQRLLPIERMAHILRSGRIGRSGESYLVNREGLLLTASRFRVQLYEMGLLRPGTHEYGKIEVRDPGGNMVTGFRPTVSRAQLPLTHMAESLIQLGRSVTGGNQHRSSVQSHQHEAQHSQVVVDMKGYRDYRGVPVMGAWQWDNVLGLGLATKIDVDEALRGYYSLRMSLLVITAITLLLTASAFLLASILGDRVTLTLRRTRDELELRVQARTQELKESQERQALALEAGELGSWDLDFDSGAFVINERYATIFHFPQDRHLDKDAWRERLHLDDQARVLAEEKRCWIGQVSNYELEYQIMTPKGDLRWVVAKGAIVAWRQDGTIRRMVGTVQDITEKKRNEEHLRFTQYAVDNAVASAFWVRPEDGSFEYVNKAACTALGYRPEELKQLGIPDIDLGFPMTQWASWAQSLRETPYISLESKQQRKDGSIFPVQMTCALTRYQDVERIIAFTEDISERKQAAEQLHRQQQRLDMALQGANAGLWDWSTVTGELITGDILATMLGYSRAELDERYGNSYDRWTQLVHPDDLPGALSALQQHINGETEIYEREFRMLTASGNWKWILDIGRASERDANGKGTRIVGIHLDIDERKAMEDEILSAKEIAEEATKAKSNFLANMSHEIRTPMNAVIGMSHLALQTDLNDKQRDYINKIHKAADSLLGIINDILDFSKIEAGKLALEAKPFRLDETLDNLVQVTSVRVQEKGLELLVDIDAGVPNGLVGDALRLTQILLNLLNNAIKFTEQGEILIRVKAVNSEAEQVTLQFSVVDHGIGMTAAQVTNLFQPFNQADNSITRKYGGTGLGLTICRSLTELMGGEIGVESAAGQGSTFFFSAEFGLSEADEPVFRRCRSELSGLAVLVVDDSPAAREIMAHLAKRLKFQVAFAASGKEAVDKVRQADQTGSPFQLVFMDWKMPEMNGIIASRKIITDTALTAPPKVILVTAYDQDEMLRAAEGITLGGYLSKPVTASSLLGASLAAMGYEKVKPLNNSVNELGLQAIAGIKGARILLVEDNEVNQQVAIGLLELAQLVVSIAENGQMAIEKLQTETFDAVLMDIQMPVLDGYRATRRVRQTLKLTELPIIAMTANAMTSDREKCLLAGMNDYIAKPIVPTVLYNVLARWIVPGAWERPVAVQQGLRELETMADESLLSLPGFDLKNALMRVGGNLQAYRKILAKVVEAEADSVERILQSLTAGDQATAVRIVHTLKSVAGNIGATSLHLLAAELEATLLQGKNRPLTGLMRRIEQSLAETLKQISAALQAVPVAASNTSTHKASQQEIIRELEKIMVRIEDYDSTVEEAVDALLAQVDEPGLQTSLVRLHTNLGDYDFEGAGVLVKEILDKRK